MQNASYNMIPLFKKLLILFWTLWWLSALWTDIVGGFAYLGWLNATWAPAKNYPFLVNSLTMYPLYDWMPAALFLSIILWMAFISIYFCQTSFYVLTNQPFYVANNRAFTSSLGLWLAFLLADQMIMNYELEANHMVQATFQLISWLFILLVRPNDAAMSDE